MLIKVCFPKPIWSRNQNWWHTKANLFSSCYDKSTVVKKYAPNIQKYTIKLRILYFIRELWLWITQTRGNRHGWATSTQVCIPGRGAGLLEGAGGETPTEVTCVKTVTCLNASGLASCFCWIPNTVSPAGLTSLRRSCRSSSRWVETTRPNWRRSWSSARAATKTCFWTTTDSALSWKT